MYTLQEGWKLEAGITTHFEVQVPQSPSILLEGFMNSQPARVNFNGL